MKIVVVTGSLPPLRCGVGFYTDKLAKHLSKTTDMAVVSGPGMSSPHAKTVQIPSWKLRHTHAVSRAITALKPDVISLQYPAKGYGRYLGINILPYLLRRHKVIVTLHEYHGSRLIGRLRNIVTCLPATKIVVSNMQDRGALPRFLRARTVVIPIGSTLTKAHPDDTTLEKLCKDAGFSRHKPVFVFFGFLFASKGLELLVDAAIAADAQVLFLGGADKRDPYQRQIVGRIEAARNGGARLFLAGYLPDSDVSRVLHASKYLVMTQPLPLSAKSSTAIAAVRHMMVVISTGAPGRESQKPYVHNENALLLDPMNFQTLTKVMREIIAGHDYYSELRPGVVALAKYFKWDTIIQAHLTLMKQVLRG
jgi:glycosyltransferase involved in cell wall biosynthesis